MAAVTATITYYALNGVHCTAPFSETPTDLLYNQVSNMVHEEIVSLGPQAAVQERTAATNKQEISFCSKQSTARFTDERSKQQTSAAWSTCNIPAGTTQHVVCRELRSRSRYDCSLLLLCQAGSLGAESHKQAKLLKP